MKDKRSKLLETIRRLKSNLKSLLASSVITNLLALSLPLYMAQIFSRVLTTQNPNTLFVLTIGVLFAISINYVLDYLRFSILKRVSQDFDVDIMETIIGGNSSDELKSSLLRIKQGVANTPTLLAAMDIVWSPLLLLALAYIHPLIGLVGLVSIGVLAGISYLLYSTNPDNSNSNINKVNVLSEFSQKHRDLLKSMRMHRRWRDVLKATIAIANKEVSPQVKYKVVLQTLLTTLSKVSYVAVIVVTILLSFYGSASPAVIIAASIIINRVTQPWVSYLPFHSVMKTLWDTLRSVESIILSDKNRFNESTMLIIPIKDSSIRLKSITLISDSGKPLLKDTTLSIPAGSIVAITGRNGTGKTLLAETLLGTRKPYNGVVEIGGVPVDCILDDEEHDNIFGYSPQEIIMYPGSISDNISSFKSDKQEVVRVTEELDIHRYIMELPYNYNTPLPKYNTYIGTSYKQLLSIARALYGTPRVIILDDTDSHQDGYFEKQIVKAVQFAKDKGSSIIMFTRRANVLQQADYSFVINGDTGKLEILNRGKEKTNEGKGD